MNAQPPARLPLAHLPTPLDPLERLGALLGARLLVKRDDCTGVAGGGNKLRKLEYILSAARDAGADVVLTAGGLQSNHARQTAAAAAKLGLSCELFLDIPVEDAGAEYEQSGNILLSRLLGARIHLVRTDPSYVEANQQLEAAVLARADELRRAGHRPWTIPLGGSSGLGALGYVHAAHELVAQCEAQDLRLGTVVLATSSGATHVGLATGLAQAGVDARVIGVCIAGEARHVRERSARVALELAELGVEAIDPASLELDDRHAGEGYGLPDATTAEAVHLAARTEALLLDPVYTGKAMAGLIAHARDGLAGDVLFLHTGGTPALFGYRRWVMDEAIPWHDRHPVGTSPARVSPKGGA